MIRSCNVQEPVVQSIVSLTSLLMTNSLTVVTMVFSNKTHFCFKNVSGFCNAKATHIFFSKKISIYLTFFKIENLMSH